MSIRLHHTYTLLLVAFAVAVSVLSCNFMMPSFNYPVMRQEKGMTVLNVYQISQDENLEEIQFGFGALDGLTSQNGIGSPDVFLSIRNRYSYEGRIFHLFGTTVDPLERNGVPFDEKQLSYNTGVGFLTTNGADIIRITANLPNILSNFVESIANIEANAGGAGSLRGFAGNIFAGTMYRGLFDDGINLNINSGGALPGTATFATYTNGMDTVAASFTRLTDAAYPDAQFWNAGKAEIRRFGFSESGAFSWFEALRRDDLADDEEIRLVALTDDGLSLKTSDAVVAGTAGDYVLTWNKREAPGFQIAVLDDRLNEVHTFKVYGRDAVYLGEALVAIGGSSENAALFAVLGLGNVSLKENDVYISILAYPTAYLAGGAP
ncbi:MAG: hypothetical protein E4H20_06265 [Spirochaetales bacterium]|nr:MAG: hypothetical protein E4H20_06265 [Spirochaetales bacterium]